MNSPTRRRDGGDDLPDEARALLRKAARPVPPTAADRAAMAAMAARIAAAPVSSGPSLPRGAWSRLAGLGAGKGVGIAGLILAIGGATWLGVRLLGAGDPSQVTAPASVATAAAPGEGSLENGASPPPAAPAGTAGTPAGAAKEGPGASADAGDTVKPDAPERKQRAAAHRRARAPRTGFAACPAAHIAPRGRSRPRRLVAEPRRRCPSRRPHRPHPPRPRRSPPVRPAPRLPGIALPRRRSWPPRRGPSRRARR